MIKTMAQRPSIATPSVDMAIILVNWNGWRDTIECLESIFHNGCENFQAIVCDNASTDESWAKIISWAAGNELVVPASDEMASYSQPPVAKPMPIKVIDQAGNVSGDPDANLIIIQTGANLGFAGGNNVGMQYALDHSSCSFFWLLNNDTVIARDAIGHLIQHMKTSPKIGMCGTRIHFYHQPDVIQALGGAKYNSWTGTSKCIGNYQHKDTKFTESMILTNSDFIVGASMCLTRRFLGEVGLMEEMYFLYYEEIDWAVRTKGTFKLGYAPDVTVFHKEGGAIGSSSIKGARSPVSEYYLMSSKIKFTRKFFPIKLLAVYLYSFAQILVRLLRGNRYLAKAIIFAMIGKALPKNYAPRAKNE